MALQTRPFEIVVWGASGFTGRLVCQHLAKDYQGRVKWAIAGRDRQKLERIKADLVKINGDCKVGVACLWENEFAPHNFVWWWGIINFSAPCISPLYIGRAHPNCRRV